MQNQKYIIKVGAQFIGPRQNTITVLMATQVPSPEDRQGK
jgi:hypothetical protein